MLIMMVDILCCHIIYLTANCKPNENDMCQGKGATIDGFIDLKCTCVCYMLWSCGCCVLKGLQERKVAART